LRRGDWWLAQSSHWSREFAYSDFGVGGSLPFDEDITADKVAASFSGYYYFYLNLHGDMTLTVTISEMP
jgi:hypothetical protein